MSYLRSLWLSSVIPVAAFAAAFGACPAKIVPKLCPAFEAAADTSYLQVRIVLDIKVESAFVWDKSHGPQTRPLRIYSDSLIAKYDLRRFGNPDYAYVPLYAPADSSPTNDEVLYHNASVTKANVGRLITEPYVATVEPGCGYRIPAYLCTEINTRPDSARIFISIGLSNALQTDSVARKAFLSQYDVRDTGWATEQCGAHGYMATPVTIRGLGMDPQVDYVERGIVSCILSVNPGTGPGTLRTPGFLTESLRNHRIDGRALHNPTPIHP